MKIPPAKIQIRFVDIDAMGHVNNAVYLSYFENARMHYFKYILGDDWDWEKDGIILLKNEVEYLKPIRLFHSVQVVVQVEHIGTKSFALSYKVQVNGEVYCKGMSTLVGYDNSNNVTIEIPSKMKEGLARLKEEQ